MPLSTIFQLPVYRSGQFYWYFIYDVAYYIKVLILLCNYGLYEKLMSIIITLRMVYIPKPEGLMEITPLKFDNYGYYLLMKDTNM